MSKTNISLYIPKAVLHKLDAQANREDRSRSNLVTRMIMLYLEEDKRIQEINKR